MLKDKIKKLLGLKPTQGLNSSNLILHCYNKISPYIYRKKYTSDDFIEKLKSMGIKEGSNIFIHSSWDAFFNYTGTEEELIQALLELIGLEGTLAMPAYPLLRKCKPFNVRKSVTKAGMLAEAFRKYPGVKRSINAEHSVCAIGPLSDYLLSEHQESLISTDKKSPYYKICIKGNFKVISLGLTSYFIGTIIHVPTSTMYNTIPYFKNIYDFEIKYKVDYIDYDNKLKTYYSCNVSPKVARRCDYFYTRYLVNRYFPKNIYSNLKISNLTVSIYDAAMTYQILADLARRGKFIYLTPRP